MLLVEITLNMEIKIIIHSHFYYLKQNHCSQSKRQCIKFKYTQIVAEMLSLLLTKKQGEQPFFKYDF